MKIKYLFCMITGVFLFFGCVEPKQFVTLENRVAAMEMERQKQLSIQAEKEKELETLQNKMDEGISLEDYAELKYDITTIKKDHQRLEGLIEEINHNLGIYDKRDTGGLQARIERLDSAISLNYEKLVEIEKYLGLEPSQDLQRSSEDSDEASVGTGSSMAATEEPLKKMGELDSYTAAKKMFDEGDKAGARGQFETFIKNFPNSEYAGNARFWIADSYYSEKWFEKAILEYQRVLEDYPKSNKEAAARLKQGYSFAELGEKANARLILNELLKKHPDSNEAKFAKEKLKTLQ